MKNGGKLANKFLGLGLLLALAVAVPIVPLMMGYSQQISDTTKEQSGVTVHRELRAVLQDIQRHRGASTSQLSGKAEFKERADKARAGVDAAIAKSDTVIAEHQNQLGQLEAWGEFKSNWLKLKVDFVSLKPTDNARQHTALISILLAAMERAADASGLVLDPELESFYLMDLAVMHLPATTEKMGQGRALGSLILSEKTLDGARRDTMVGGVVEVALRQKSILGDGEKIALANKETSERLKTLFEAAKGGIATYRSNVEQNILRVETLVYEPARFFDEATQAIDASFKLYDAAITSLDSALESRVSRIRNQRLIVSLIALALIALAAVMAFVTLRRVNHSIVVAAGAMEQIAGGNLSLALKPESNDEVGALILSIDDMQQQLRQRLEAERQAANETLRLKVALDVTSNNVMVADPDGKIIYCNAAVMEMMTNAESDIRKELPNFRASAIVGSNFDIYHKQTSHQRNILGALSTSHRAEVLVGGRTFALVANPIINAERQRLGTVVEWRDRTAEVKIEGDVSEIIHAAAKGDFGKRLDAEQMSGFFKHLSAGINNLLEANTSALSNVGTTLSCLSSGDLTHKIDTEYEGLLGKLKDDANATVDQLREIVLSIKDAADAINTAAREISAGNQDLSSRTEEQASSLEETASSMEQLTSTVKQNADNANQASKLAIDAQKIAVEGGEMVSRVVHTMDAIHHSSGRIADIIGVIDGIAFQTNILALNAAVEAARAGEQGRGFAVVATEVRNLAKRSADAAKEIKTLISDSVDKIESGNVLVNQAGQTMENVVASIRKVSSIIVGISEASREQSAGIEQVSLAVSQMDEVTQQNAALVEQAAAAAESLEEQAGNLTRAVAVFQMSKGGTPRLQAPERSRQAPPAAEARKLPPRKAPPRLAASLDDEWAEF